ncbi:MULTISPECIES: hypothetical protein [unclassified Streptococcus]|uniref:hypothetical protein n=1 Tax=unclassified Streptococcus TaxID=2608887 RepID=UPI00211B26E1|nr:MULTISPECIES: hypothetical protein [unclassified Streptococcus]MCQ9211642.1 hypothetical protein [Streptococcus sp. B01]MCQ9213159.1 hypothetical protein [Streptococcus sp. O1]MCQ9214947.1 hypothetical protein [Streptococcus sp. O1]MCQ9215081.1 hypothetical protein [Streptococcus sp. O1]
MTTHIKSLIMLIAILLLTTFFMMLSTIQRLQWQIDSMHQRIEVITQQLQEMSRYVQYPGG